MDPGFDEETVAMGSKHTRFDNGLDQRTTRQLDWTGSKHTRFDNGLDQKEMDILAENRSKHTK